MHKISEAPSDTHYMSQADAEEFIASMDPDATAHQDIVDEEDQWVYIEAGDTFGEAKMKPEPEGKEVDCEECNDMGGSVNSEGLWDPCEGCGDYWEIRNLKSDRARKKFEEASEKYASNYENWSEETGWGTGDESADEDMYRPEHMCSDAAEGFFYEYPEWEEWAEAIGMKKSTMKEVITDMVYDAMTRSVK